MKFNQIAVLFLLASTSIYSFVSADTVVSNSIADLQIFPSNGQDRNELILGNANGDRTYVTRFDTSVIAPFLNSNYQLTSARVMLTEQFGRDSANGNQSRSVAAYVLNTGENSLWDYTDVDALNNFQNGVTPWFGNTQARPGRFGGQGSGGDSNVDLRADIDNVNLGSAVGSFTFSTGQMDSVEIDLTDGSGLTLADIESLLNDWVNGENAGIGLIDRTSAVFPGESPLGQIFFQSGNVAGGNPVNSTVNGVISGNGVAQNGEAGNGLGGPQLILEFESLVVPEPGSTGVVIFLSVAMLNNRRRKQNQECHD